MEELPDSLVPHLAGPLKHPFGVKNGGDNSPLDLPPLTTKSGRHWCLERTRIRRCPSDHDYDVESNSEAGEAGEDPGNGGVYGPHVPAESAGEKEERGLEHHRETLDEVMQRPFLEPISFALTVSATLDHRPARIAQVPV